MAMVITKKTVKVLGIVGALIVVALGANFAVLPTLNGIQSKQEEIVTSQDEIETLQASRDALASSKASYEQIKEINAGLVAQFPETGQTQLLIEQILYGANINGIPSDSVTSVSFTAPQITTPDVAPVAPPAEAAEGEGEAAAAAPVVETAVADGYGSMEIAVSLEATPDQVRGFLTYLNTLDRAVTIKAASLSGNAETGTVQLSFTASVYIYKPIPEPTDIAPVSEEGIVEEGVVEQPVE